jgi:hypothetical protein
MKCIVRMSSDEFGTDEFHRDSLKEARNTVRNLRKEIKRLNDGVERTIEIIVK